MRIGLTVFLIIIFSTGISSQSNYTIKIDNFSSKVFNTNDNKFILESSDKNFKLYNGISQKIIWRKTGIENVTIKIRTGKNRKKIISKQERKVFLENSNLLNLNSREIKKIVKKINPSGNILHNVEKYVYRYIYKKTLGIPIISAKEIVKIKTGDCTEHSILTISMLRKLKIPSRAVAGLILEKKFMGIKNVFVYHMWVEAFYKGRWHLVDATRPDTKFYNRYIAFTYHDLKTVAPLNYLEALSRIDNLKIRYIK